MAVDQLVGDGGGHDGAQQRVGVSAHGGLVGQGAGVPAAHVGRCDRTQHRVPERRYWFAVEDALVVNAGVVFQRPTGALTSWQAIARRSRRS